MKERFLKIAAITTIAGLSLGNAFSIFNNPIYNCNSTSLFVEPTVEYPYCDDSHTVIFNPNNSFDLDRIEASGANTIPIASGAFVDFHNTIQEIL